MKKILCAVALPMLAACAGGPETSSIPSGTTAQEERESRTGSNVSRRSRAAAPERSADAPTK